MIRAMKKFSLLLAATASLLSAQTRLEQPSPARQQFLKLIDRPRVPLAAETRPLDGGAEFEKQGFSFAAEARERVPGIALKSAGVAGKLPVVIVMHGTGG